MQHVTRTCCPLRLAIIRINVYYTPVAPRNQRQMRVWDLVVCRFFQGLTCLFCVFRVFGTFCDSDKSEGEVSSPLRYQVETQKLAENQRWSV